MFTYYFFKNRNTQNAKSRQLIKQPKKKSLCNSLNYKGLCVLVVEPEGVEPSSRQSARELSTCLVTDLIVGRAGGSVTNLCALLSSLSFDRWAERAAGLA
jgi:hypothetical protein